MNDNTFESNTDALCAEDLLVLERRRTLTDHEQRRLSMCLAASDALRILRQLHQDFEAIDPENPNEARITELCVTAAKRRFVTREPRTWGRRTRLRMALVGASALLLTLAAAAASYRGEFWGHGVRQGSLPSQVSTPTQLAMSADPILAESGPNPQTVEPKIAPDAEVIQKSVSHSSETIAHTEPPTLAANNVKSAVELFSAANAARRGRRTQEAVALYQRLHAEYPSSDEALVSHVLLARLQLGRGAASVALREFDAYLERVPRGSLTQEALQGRAQALSRLGRKREETATWRRLLQEFPNSVYAQSAREHLDEGAQF